MRYLVCYAGIDRTPHPCSGSGPLIIESVSAHWFDDQLSTPRTGLSYAPSNSSNERHPCRDWNDVPDFEPSHEYRDVKADNHSVSW